MKCSNCGFDNIKDSSFCQECGVKLEVKHDKQESSSIYKDIEDVVFTPKKKSSAVTWVIITLIALGLIGFAIIFVSYEQTATESQATQETTTNISDVTDDTETEFPLYKLSITNPSMDWRGYYRDQAFFKGTLKNDHNKPATLIKIRLDFSFNEDMKDIFDTRYIYISGVAANGAYSFDELVSGFFTEKQFWYLSKIEGASF